MPPPPILADDVIEEVLLRIPLDDPASLVRAAAVCKPWCRVASDPGFRARFRERHHLAATPVLGVLCNLSGRAGTARLVTTSSFRAHLPGGRRHWRVLDSRHGRVLLVNLDWELGPVGSTLVVWDPVTGDRLELPELPSHPETLRWTSWNAAVLCAGAVGSGACDHVDCRRGPFLVALVGVNSDEVSVHVYSSELGQWSLPTSCGQEHIDLDYLARGSLVGNAVHFMCEICIRTLRYEILKYDLSTREISMIHLPYELSLWALPVIDLPLRRRREVGPRILLTTSADDGGLGFAIVHDSILYQWERKAGPDGAFGWAQKSVTELQTLLPADAMSISTELVGFADGVGIFFVETVNGLFSIDLKSGQVKKVHNDSGIRNVVPYMSLCLPGLGSVSTGEGPGQLVLQAHERHRLLVQGLPNQDLSESL
ncbi:unnamed protein product [Urochloa decumbens]|uniref:F-box domain-containing protein n=1 Tax=Urochloa decumbens TaxID=240449 RepID=A0ABC9BS47_9POAL